jgi:hypothetical protein
MQARLGQVHRRIAAPQITISQDASCRWPTPGSPREFTDR